MSFGWQGYAWSWLTLERAGLCGRDPWVMRAIRRNLEASLERRPGASGPSHFVGVGADALVAALAAQEDRGLLPLRRACLRRWSSLACSSDATDLISGSAGGLLAAAEIEAVAPGIVAPALLLQLHRRTEASLRRELAAAPEETVYLGLAHGLAGRLLALEIARAVFALPLPPSLRARSLARLASESVAAGRRALAWPILAGMRVLRMHGWCNGGPGIGYALLLGRRLSGERAYDALWPAALDGARRFQGVNGTHCCGSAGRAQILLEAYRLTRRPHWLRWAAAVARQTPARLRGGQLARGLQQGRLGRLFLSWRLAFPDRLPMPGFAFVAAARPAAGRHCPLADSDSVW